MTIALQITSANLAYSRQVIFSNLNFTLKPGKWSALLGRSGCGKSSLLRTIAGLTTGTFTSNCLLQGQIAYMAQDDLLLPWYSLLDNLLLGYKLRGEDVQFQRQRALSLLEQVGLGKAAPLRPAQLSGGMRQRAALVRTLLEDRPIVLMDEPFSALDAITRFQLHSVAVELLEHKSVLFVTHDPLEALRLADDIYLLEPYPGSLRHLLTLTEPKPRLFSAPEVLNHQQVIYDYLSSY